MKHLLTLAALLTTLTAPAQRTWGLLAAPNASTFNSGVNMASPNVTAGLFYRSRVFTVTALYEQKGARYGHIDSTSHYKMRTDNITLTIVAGIPLGSQVRLSGGVYGGYMLDRVRAKYWADETDISWLRNHWIVHAFDVGLTLDVQDDLGPLIVGARYSQGLISVGKFWYAPLWREYNTTAVFYLAVPLTKKNK